MREGCGTGRLGGPDVPDTGAGYISCRHSRAERVAGLLGSEIRGGRE